ncbi:MAG: hypothetical protein WKF83_14080 [Nocardioidaceae bacterium]
MAVTRRTTPGRTSPRTVGGTCRRIHADFEKQTGLHMRIGTEPEMMWLKLNPDGTPSVEGKTKPYCYHIDQFSELQPVIHRVIEYSTAMGLDMIQGDHEDAPGQLELNWQFDRAEYTADRLTTYRQICKQVGREFDLFLASCPSRSWGSRPTGATTISPCGRANATPSSPRATTRGSRARSGSTLSAASWSTWTR